MSVRLHKPTTRICERCNRTERWDEGLGAWQIAREEREKLVGNPHCIHEWDINGTFNPIGGTD